MVKKRNSEFTWGRSFFKLAELKLEPNDELSVLKLPIPPPSVIVPPLRPWVNSIVLLSGILSLRGRLELWGIPELRGRLVLRGLGRLVLSWLATGLGLGYIIGTFLLDGLGFINLEAAKKKIQMIKNYDNICLDKRGYQVNSLHENICCWYSLENICWYSLEAPHWGASNDYQHMFSWRNKKIITIFWLKKVPYLKLWWQGCIKVCLILARIQGHYLSPFVPLTYIHEILFVQTTS